jgi:prepilin-type N-terminal cleavage/methylation domain-containing protein
MKSKEMLFDERGFTLVEVLIASALVGGVALLFTNMITNQQKELKNLYQKSDILEFKNQMMGAFMKPGVCSWQLLGKVVDVSSTTIATPSPTVIDFGVTPLYQGLDASSAVMAQAGAPLPISTNGIDVKKVSFKNIFATGIINQYYGVFEIEFLAQTSGKTHKSVQIYQSFTTNNNTATAQILSCGLSSSSGQWVSIPSGGTQDTNHVFYTSSAGQPALICQNAGFSNYTGACRGINNSGNYIEGTVVANSNSGNWALSCHFGASSFYFSATLQAEILCI